MSTVSRFTVVVTQGRNVTRHPATDRKHAETIEAQLRASGIPMDRVEIEDSAEARIPCPWWWCDWFKLVFPSIHAHPTSLPPWWRHTVTLTPSQARRVIDTMERLVPEMLPPPDLLMAAVRMLYLSELAARNAGKKFGVDDVDEKAIERIYERIAGDRYLHMGKLSVEEYERRRRANR